MDSPHVLLKGFAAGGGGQRGMGHPGVLPGEVAQGWVPTGLTAGPGVGQPGPGAPPCAPSTQVPPPMVEVFAYLI